MTVGEFKLWLELNNITDGADIMMRVAEGLFDTVVERGADGSVEFS